eukprot:CAMPEP_0195008220 /NCGR_PEP_ID=MMETSP0326_2-20130528/8284_1 /TAXON_ID=2866 ORGANISM="Crypthecodinium cohnii, Strain Seligo" /NCGR_SAMPLE_ID=MMETSP0326_2 /ASSEMBLY_ACC=CAM_ASM_000348 /LENGTH=96 /DNA_ID=CAMNT_0040015933 /DNA_START=50 /DNA_END=337 /DNA_ORIENTATION=-
MKGEIPTSLKAQDTQKGSSSCPKDSSTARAWAKRAACGMSIDNASSELSGQKDGVDEAMWPVVLTTADHFQALQAEPPMILGPAWANVTLTAFGEV